MNPFPGCNAIKAAVDEGYLRFLECYREPEGEALDMILTFSDGLEPLEERPVFILNYCPFCGMQFEKGQPQCAGRVGKRRERHGYIES